MLTLLNSVLSMAIVLYMLHVESDLADLNAKVTILIANSGIELPRDREPEEMPSNPPGFHFGKPNEQK